MPGIYNIRYTDGSKTPIAVPPVTKNEQTTLDFYGFRSPVYGEAIWQNMLRMLEHFASVTPPNRPVSGQIWVDTTTTPPIPKVWMFNNPSDTPPATGPLPPGQWFPIGAGVNVGTTAPVITGGLWYNPSGPSLNYWNGSTWENILCFDIAKTCEYNDIVQEINPILISIGQPPIAQLPLSIPSPTTAQWNALTQRIRELATLRAIITPAPGSIAVTDFRYCSDSNCGMFSIIRQFQIMYDAIQSISVAQKLDTIAITCLETLFPTSGSATRTTAWDDITHTATFTFASPTALSNFFNAGGRILWGGAMPTFVTPDDGRGQSWRTKLQTIGQIEIRANSTRQTSGSYTTPVGINQLTATDQILFTQVGSTASGYFGRLNSLIQIRARIDGNAVIVSIRMHDPEAGSIQGDLSSTFAIQRVSAACLEPALAYPIVSGPTTIPNT